MFLIGFSLKELFFIGLSFFNIISYALDIYIIAMIIDKKNAGGFAIYKLGEGGVRTIFSIVYAPVSL